MAPNHIHTWLTGLALGSLGFGLNSCSSEAAEEGLLFLDVAERSGLDVPMVTGDPRRWYIFESNGSGAAWLDYDSDGDQDLFLGNGARVEYLDDGARLRIETPEPCRLYRNDSDDSGGGRLRFTEVSEDCGADARAYVNAVTVADPDNDGDPDVYLAGFGGDVYLRNDGGRFVDATAEAGLGNELWGAGAAFGDVDGDGALDLYVANYVLFDPEQPPAGGQRQLFEGVEVGYGPEEENKQGYNLGAPDRFWRGDGKGGFVEATEAAGFGLEKDLCSYACVFTDIDMDGDADLLVANDLQPCNLFVNQGDGTFVDEGMERGFAVGGDGNATAAMGLALADVDGDGDQDVLRTNFDFEANGLHLNDGRGFYREAGARFGLAQASVDRLGWGACFFDAECDGDLDLLVANGHVMPQAQEIGMSGWTMQSQLFEGILGEEGEVRFRDATAQSGPGLFVRRSARGLALGDPDNDGDLDALITDIDAPPRLLENLSTRKGRWIRIALQGTASTRDAFGARVVVRAGGRSWTREMRTNDGLYSSHDPRLHFGLGEVEGIEHVEVSWPSGRRSKVLDPELDATLTLVEPGP